MLAVQENEILNTQTPAVRFPVPVFEESDELLRASLTEQRPVYVALVEGIRDHQHYYGSRAVLEQFPVLSARALTDAVESLQSRYDNDCPHSFGYDNAPWYAIVITEKPTSPRRHREPVCLID